MEISLLNDIQKLEAKDLREIFNLIPHRRAELEPTYAPVNVNPRKPPPPPPRPGHSKAFAGNFPLFDERKVSGTLTSFARHPRTAGEWTGVFSTEVDWVKNRKSGKRRLLAMKTI